MRGEPSVDTEVRAADATHHLHPFSSLPGGSADSLTVMCRGEGLDLYDDQGRCYLDVNSGGLSCVTLGYGRTEIVEAIAAQLRELPYYSVFDNTTTRPTATLVGRLAQLAPSPLEWVFLTSSGSMANETAIRLARTFFGRRGQATKTKVIAYRGSYHGSSQLTASLTGFEPFRTGFALDEFVVHVPFPNLYRRADGQTSEEFCAVELARLEDTIAAVGSEQIACLIAEPVMSVGGVVVPPEGYHAAAREICRRNDILYIADEVVTGLGRLGAYFASAEVYGSDPDMVTLGKGLSSGYVSLAATVVSEQIYDVLASEEPRSFSHGFTYSGHSASCAAALAVLDILERERLCSRVEETGRYLGSRLAELADLPIVGDVRGRGLLHAVEVVADRAGKRSFDPDFGVGRRLAAHCRERGVLVRGRPDGVLLSPAFSITAEQIDRVADVLGTALRAVMADRPGA